MQLHRNQMDLYTLSSIQHVFFYCMDLPVMYLPVDVFYLLLLLLFSPPLDLPGGRACRFLTGGLGPLVAVV